jgi:anti-sigma regulatory factor (Ser/Thr protein kinase)
MPAGRRAALVVAVLVLLVLAVLAVFAAVPVLMVVVSALLALVVGLRLRVKSTRSRWRPRGTRPSAQRWPTAPAAAADQAGPTWTTSWPTVPPPEELPTVRERVATLLTEWDVSGEAAQPTLLVLTELLTNAIEHGSAPIRITLGFTSAFVRVQVHDGARQPPQTRPHDPTQIRGLGLQIVEALALRRGWTPEPDGKTVWADAPTDWPEPPPHR